MLQYLKPILLVISMSLVARHDTSFKVSSMPTKFRYIFICATIFGAVYVFLSIGNISRILLHGDNMLISWNDIEIVNEENKNTEDNAFTIRTKGCTIPFLDPYDSTVKEFIEYPTMETVCPNATYSYLDSNRTHIWVKYENKKHYNISEKDDVTCCYQSFYRPVLIKDIRSTNNDNRVEYRKCKYFKDFIKAKDEFVRVICRANNITIYKQYYVFANWKHWSYSNSMVNNKLAYNVIVMGLDAISRLNFHRTMPKTQKYFKDKGAVELLGYNKVGDNTFPNLIPMLMGISEQELKTTCIPNARSTFDNCPFIWEWFRQAGYYTAFGEDSSWLGTFNYVRNGFLGNPTDYYLHTFMNEAEDNIGTVKDFNSYICMNEKYFYEVLLNYLKNLITTLKMEKLFGFFWEISMSHDYLNYPMLIDDKYVTFFKNLEETQYLDKTIFLLVSDHGIRWGDIRSTKQGRLEERLPLVYVLLPKSFQIKYSKAFDNLKLNAKRLTTPYDLHATLTDLLNIENIENENINIRKSQFYSKDRSISLFLPIPTNRTCSIANIHDHWCTCHRSVSISTDSIDAIEAADMLVVRINLLLQNYKQCSKLKLTKILEVNVIKGSSVDDVTKGWQEYMVVIQTVPGDGLFEGTLRHYSTKWSLEGTISRLNLYGEQSYCVNDNQLKLYCFC